MQFSQQLCECTLAEKGGASGKFTRVSTLKVQRNIFSENPSGHDKVGKIMSMTTWASWQHRIFMAHNVKYKKKFQCSVEEEKRCSMFDF